jgi:Skp family chaperone for outer membrane proteins
MLLAAELQQRQVLQAEAAETNQVVRELKGREAELSSQVAKAQKASRQLDRAISDIIRREIEIARKKAEEERKRTEAAERKRREDEERRLAASRAASTPSNNGTSMVLVPTASS